MPSRYYYNTIPAATIPCQLNTSSLLYYSITIASLTAIPHQKLLYYYTSCYHTIPTNYETIPKNYIIMTSHSLLTLCNLYIHAANYVAAVQSTSSCRTPEICKNTLVFFHSSNSQLRWACCGPSTSRFDVSGAIHYWFICSTRRFCPLNVFFGFGTILCKLRGKIPGEQHFLKYS